MSNKVQDNQRALAEQTWLTEKFKHLSERELLEKQTQLALQTSKNTNRIMLNVQFFFWITIITIVVGVLGGLVSIVAQS